MTPEQDDRVSRFRAKWPGPATIEPDGPDVTVLIRPSHDVPTEVFARFTPDGRVRGIIEIEWP